MTVDIARLSAHLPPEQRASVVHEYRRRAESETAAFLYCFFLGIFGMHRFYLNQWGQGFPRLIVPLLAAVAIVAGWLGNVQMAIIAIVVAVLLLIGLVWEIADLFHIDDEVRARNQALANRLVAGAALADTTLIAEALAKLDQAVTEQALGSPHDTYPSAPIPAVARESAAAAAATPTTEPPLTLESYVATTTTRISGDPNATTPGAPNTGWSASEPFVTGDVDGDATEPENAADEMVTVTHSETAYSATDAVEVDRLTLPDGPPADEAPPVWPVDPSRGTDPLPEPDPAVESLTAPLGEAAPVAGFAAAGLAAAGLAAGAATTPGEPAHTFANDLTDSHPHVHHVAHVADAPEVGGTPVYVILPDEAPVVAVPEHDWTDRHPHIHHAHVIADIEADQQHAIYVTLPGEPAPTVTPPAGDDGIAALGFGVLGAAGVAAVAAGGSAEGAATPEVTPVEEPPVPPRAFIPPTVPLTTAAAEPVVSVPPAVPVAPAVPAPVPDMRSYSPETLEALAGFDGTTGRMADEPPMTEPPIMEPVAGATSEPAPSEAAPVVEPAPETPSAQRFKRVRVKRQLIVDGQVLEEQVVEEIVPLETDTAVAAAGLQQGLKRSTPEEIAQKAHLESAEIDLRQKIEMPRQDGE